MGVAVAHPVSPELVLVCPELRAQALELLPAPDPDALFDVSRPPTGAVVALRPQPVQREHAEPVERERRPAAPVAVAAYVAEAVVLGALRGAVMIAAVAVLAYLLAR